MKQYFFKKQIFLLGLIKEGISEARSINFFGKYFSKNDERVNLIEEILEKFFSKYDTSRCTILTKLLHTASVNGDNIEFENCYDSHSKIIIIKTDQGKIFAAFYDKNCEVFYNLNIMDKIKEDSLIISLDTGESIETGRKIYEEYDLKDDKKIKGINFGDILIISDSCLSNQCSRFRHSNFKVLDYEIFSIYLKSFN